MKIGFVLFNSPEKSETFLISKINNLIESGCNVVMFANQKNNFSLCKVIPHPTVYKNFVLQIFKIIVSNIIFFIKRPRIFINFLNLEKKDNISFQDRWKNLYLNNHILSHDLDWIYFGFATTAIRRENVSKSINAKMGLSIRGYDIYVYPLKDKDCYKRLWFKIDKLHSISNHLLKSAEQYGLDDRTTKIVIRPSIDINYFINKKKISKLKINRKKIQFLTIARLHWVKGLEYAMQALSVLKQKNLNFSYTIIGGGQEYERLIYAAHQMDLDENISFIGPQTHNVIKDYLQETDIYLQYSIQEGFCNAVLEAQAMGLLCIVSDANGLIENITHNHTGWVVPKMAPELLADRIEKVLLTPDETLTQIRHNAITRINRDFSLSKQKDMFFEFYNK